MGFEVIDLQVSGGNQPDGFNAVCPNITVCIELICLNGECSSGGDTFCNPTDTGCADCMCDFDIGCDPFGPEGTGGNVRPR